MSRRSILAFALGVAALAAAAAGWAHAALVRASPAPRATLQAPPSRVELTFNERLEPAYARVSVWDDGGRQVDLRDGAVDPRDPRVLRVSLPPLAPGRYTVRYRVLSVDGHVVESAFPFAVRGR